jgi:hypothetical protein
MAVARSELLLTESLFSASEKASSYPPLKIGPNSCDLDIDLAKLDEHNRFAKSYEETCFKRVLEELEPNQVAYGAHFLNRALGGLPIAEEERVSVPDAIVGDIVSTRDDGKSIILLTRIIEARTGRVNGNGKLRGFSTFTRVIRRTPNYFPGAFEKVLMGRGDKFGLELLIAPSDSEIDIVFYSPRDQKENGVENRQTHINGHSFRSVSYETVPLEVFPGNL